MDVFWVCLLTLVDSTSFKKRHRGLKTHMVWKKGTIWGLWPLLGNYMIWSKLPNFLNLLFC